MHPAAALGAQLVAGRTRLSLTLLNVGSRPSWLLMW